jgi:hypothetical protein
VNCSRWLCIINCRRYFCRAKVKLSSMPRFCNCL